ncbi:MAG: hypothetical protein N2Z23_02535 [Pyrinomonadaceae bacterium]|nr:hypothetical protein [Pyrinomonadaceae bacterium]MDW8303470.1 hypothetical protein [Acidobacteriota bacterium]
MKKVAILFLVFFVFACQKEKSTADSPTEAYKMLYRAVKSKNPEEIKKWLSNGTLMLAEAKANMEKSSVEKVIKNGFTETTFSAAMPEIRDERISGDFGAVEVWNERRRLWEDLPFVKEAEVSFEFVGDDRAKVTETAKAIQGMEVIEEANKVYGRKRALFSEAEEIAKKLLDAGATAKVDNTSWRLAVGEIFSGVYKSPGKPRSLIEREAANMASQSMPPQANVNVNSANVNKAEKKVAR